MKETWMMTGILKTIIKLATSAGIFFLIFPLTGAVAQEPLPVPVVDAHLGNCSADFTVVDERGTPIYDAKIDVSLRYGFMGLRRMSLQVGTNSQGKARVDGLPEKSDRTLRFEITSGSMLDTVLMTTQDQCNGTFKVVLVHK
jgi:hypothetical protein